MPTRIFIFFLPGCAGNFFTRSLTLSNDLCIGYVPRNIPLDRLNLSLEEKFTTFSYNNCKQHRRWTDFETQLVRHVRLVNSAEWGSSVYSIWDLHPSYVLLNKDLLTNQQCFAFYIDPEDNFEWGVLNALYKDSYLDPMWMKTGKEMLNDPTVHKISLTNIISSKETCVQEVLKIANIVGFETPQKNLDKIFELWDQWYPTTLKKQDFAAFKAQIGFNM